MICRLFLLFSKKCIFLLEVEIEVVSLNFDNNSFLKGSYFRTIWVNNCYVSRKKAVDFGK